VGKEELVRFEENREEAFTKNLEEHAALQLKHSKQKINVLENMIKVILLKKLSENPKNR
jgi:hypothetical protein